MKQSVIEMNQVQVYQKDRQVLQIRHLNIQQGELVAVVGPNGAGKSTLLKVANLLLPYQSGSFRLFGCDVKQTDLLALRRRCSMVFQDSLLLNETVFKNVALPLKLRGMAEKSLHGLVQEALATFHCLHLTQRSASQLSGGEAQRVSLARAMAYKPELLLLDEPFASIDQSTQSQLLADIKEAAQELGITVLLVSHNFSDVLYFAERVLVLREGQLIQEDKPESILRRPVNQAVAELTGMDNILSCQITQRDQTFVTLENGVKFEYSGPVPAKISACCLPGDAIQLSSQKSSVPLAWVTCTGVIHQVVPGIGIYQVLVNAQGLQLKARVPRSEALGRLQPGMTVQIAFSPQEAHLVEW